jgi:hypothetical protein
MEMVSGFALPEAQYHTSAQVADQQKIYGFAEKISLQIFPPWQR